MARVLILNGTSSAGKSSIAKALQSKLPAPYLHVELDAFWNMLPAGATPKDFPGLVPAIIDSAVALARRGSNVILDIVAPASVLVRLKEALCDFPVYVVGVKAAPEILRARESLRPDRKPGLAEGQARTLHADIVYDFQIDTSTLSAEQGAEAIVRACLGPPAPPKATPAFRPS